MPRSSKALAQHYRVWITQPQGGPCEDRDEASAPPVVLEPAEPGVLSARQARCYVEAFNRTARRLGRSTRAVAIAVALRYEGDPLPGRPLLETEGPGHNE